MNPLLRFNACRYKPIDSLVRVTPDKFKKHDIVPNQNQQKQMKWSKNHSEIIKDNYLKQKFLPKDGIRNAPKIEIITNN